MRAHDLGLAKGARRSFQTDYILFFFLFFEGGGVKECEYKQLKVNSGLAGLQIVNDEKQAMQKRAKRGSGVVIHLIRDNPPTSNPHFVRHCFRTAGENGEHCGRCCMFKALKTVTKENPTLESRDAICLMSGARQPLATLYEQKLILTKRRFAFHPRQALCKTFLTASGCVFHPFYTLLDFLPLSAIAVFSVDDFH